MSDLWSIASADVEGETLDRHLTTARVASAAVWPFLAAAATEAEYLDRKALASDRLDRIASASVDGDPVLFSVVRASLGDSFDQDFAVLHGERVAAAQIEAGKTAARQQREAAIRARAERQALEKILAGAANVDVDGGSWCPTCAGHGKILDKDLSVSTTTTCPDCDGTGNRKTAGESRRTAASDGDTSTCKNCGKPVEYVETAWVHTPSFDLRCMADGDGRIVQVQNTVAEPKTSSRRTAGIWCKSHDVWVGPGNADTHAGCKKEQKATDKTKDASLQTTAGDSVEVSSLPKCDVCKMQGKDNDAKYDSRLPGLGGSWGNVCQPHFDQHGPGSTGTGNAQKLVVKSQRITAAFPPGNNPFGGGDKKPPSDSDAGAPDQTKPDAGNTDTWKCPSCGSSNAYTQGGVELAEALKAKQPIQCGDCKAVDSTGGQAPAAPADPATAPAPHPGPPHAASLTVSAGQPVGTTYTLTPGGWASVQTANTTSADRHPFGRTAAPFNPISPGVPDDMTDGPHMPRSAPMAPQPTTEPLTTRPRAMPDAPNTDLTAPAVPGDPAAPPTDDPAAPAKTPPPKKAAGLGFTSAAFKTAAEEGRCPRTKNVGMQGKSEPQYARCTLDKGHEGEHAYDPSKAMPGPVGSKKKDA